MHRAIDEAQLGSARVFEVAHFRPVGNPTDPASVEIRFDN
jgi:hypothetical protein